MNVLRRSLYGSFAALFMATTMPALAQQKELPPSSDTNTDIPFYVWSGKISCSTDSSSHLDVITFHPGIKTGVPDFTFKGAGAGKRDTYNYPLASSASLKSTIQMQRIVYDLKEAADLACTQISSYKTNPLPYVSSAPNHGPSCIRALLNLALPPNGVGPLPDGVSLVDDRLQICFRGEVITYPMFKFRYFTPLL